MSREFCNHFPRRKRTQSLRRTFSSKNWSKQAFQRYGNSKNRILDQKIWSNEVSRIEALGWSKISEIAYRRSKDISNRNIRTSEILVIACRRSATSGISVIAHRSIGHINALHIEGPTYQSIDTSRILIIGKSELLQVTTFKKLRYGWGANKIKHHWECQ